ncbi:hypothetical protein BC830DRAFT_1086457 [Chytriomyces sp. MP71]|nr:hypothetical protein BC830DRAFT_1086457 [Chytriomyces sp. MP71]
MSFACINTARDLNSSLNSEGRDSGKRSNDLDDSRHGVPPPASPYKHLTPANDPSFFLYYYIDLPLFLLGTLFSGYIAWTLFRNRTRLVTDRLDRIICLLIGIYFVWSFAAYDTFYRVCAVVTSIQLLFLFSGNTLLAMERMFVIREFTIQQSKHYLLGVILYTGIASGIIMALFISSPSHDAISPADQPQQTIWLIGMLITFILASTTITVLYSTTYRYSARMLRLALEVTLPTSTRKPDAALIAIRLERKILRKCALMAGIVFVCYAPEAVSFAIIRMAKVDQYARGLFEFQCIARALLVADVLITPAFILHFMPEIRRAAFGNRFG